MSNEPENPWASPKATRPTAPPPGWSSGERRGGGGNIPPLPPFKMPTQGPAIAPRRIFALALMAVVILWLASGLYRVLPEENAVLLHFGEDMRTSTDPGVQ